MTRPAVFSFPAASTTAVCSAQTTAGAGALTIDGSLIDTASLSQGVRRAWLSPTNYSFQRTVSLTSAGNASGVTFTIVGQDCYGRAVSESIAGPNITTVYTTNLFALVTSVTVGGALAAATSIGTGTTGSSLPFRTNYFNAPANFALYGELTATLNWTVQDTPDDVETLMSNTANAQSVLTWFNHTTLVNQTASASSNYAFPARWIRVLINSSSAGGALVFTIVPAGK
jgi:hypothetical protein